MPGPSFACFAVSFTMPDRPVHLELLLARDDPADGRTFS